MKNLHAQEMQKLSTKAKIKKHGGKRQFREYMQEIGKRGAELRWKKAKKLSTDVI